LESGDYVIRETQQSTSAAPLDVFTCGAMTTAEVSYFHAQCENEHLLLGGA